MGRISVAVVDTGIFPHMDIENKIIGFKDMIHNRRVPYDDNGHGTHVSSIISKMAPGVYLTGIKVLDRNGKGKSEYAIDAMKWIIDNKEKYGIRIVNISIGTREEEESSDLVKAVESVWEAGIVVVCAAGNNGPDNNTITTPGVSRKIITVGSYDVLEYKDRAGNIRKFYSGRGPTSACVVKPDVVAKGNHVLGCNNSRKGYVYKSGTSMAAPYISGAIARLLIKKPDMSPKEVKLLLREKAVDMGKSRQEQGWGRIDADRLIE